MPRGGRLAIDLARAARDAIPAELDPHAEYVVLTVTDTGTGMSDATLARIFEPFFSTKADGKGTGLGLSTVYGVVKQTGGAVTVTSAPEKGTRFTVFFPVADRAAAARARDDVTAEAFRGSGTVLLVEDQAALRSVMRRLLESVGFDVVEAADPAEALSVARSSAAPIRLLVTDVVMPRMNGRELAEQIASERPDVKVLYVSGYPADDLVRRGANEGTVALLRKPFTSLQLARAVRDVLGT
jgi:CheY-like chemotaxis protein